jgi:hypothetical protein
VYNNGLYILDAGTLIKRESKDSFTKLADAMEGGTDGVEYIANNEFLVSTWSGVVYYVKADGSKEVLIDGRAQKINSADIGYDAKRRIVYVPTFWKNTVAAYELK